MNYDVCANKLIHNFNKKMYELKYDNYSFTIHDIVSPLNNLSDDDFEKVVEIIINKNLLIIKDSNNKKQYDDLWTELGYRFCNKDINMDIWEQADIVSDELVKKALCVNGRTIELPIKVKNIIDYGIAYFISKEEIRTMLEYIVFQLLILNYILKSKN